jgi:hypothetical protein
MRILRKWHSEPDSRQIYPARDALAGARDPLPLTASADLRRPAGDAVVIPLGRRLRPLLTGQAAHPAGGMWPIGLHRRTPDAEHVPVAGVVGPVNAVEDLHLERSRERHADGRQCIAPDEQPGVATPLKVPPFQLDDEVLVLPVGPHDADWVSGAHQHAVLDTPGVGGGIDVEPPGKVLAVEQIAEVVVGLSGNGTGQSQHTQPYRAQCEERVSLLDLPKVVVVGWVEPRPAESRPTGSDEVSGGPHDTLRRSTHPTHHASVQPLRYSRWRNGSASGALGA